MNNVDVLIIGAGAAGLMCAIEAGKRGKHVLVLDKASKIGQKILISGGGRCNFTNLYTCPEDYLSQNPHFCKSALSRYTPWDFIALVENHGLSWTEKTLGQLFCEQKAPAIVKLLSDECKKSGVQIQLETKIESIEKSNHFTVKSNCGDYQAKSLVIATGGPSIPAMGSSDFALKIAKQFSLKSIAFQPALVPLTFSSVEFEKQIKPLSGISVPVEICTESGHCFKEAILFTHRGLSGPATLQASSYWRPGETISIDLLPDLGISNWLESQQKQHPQAELKTILAYQLPKRLASMLCSSILENKPMQKFSQHDLQQIAKQLHHWRLKPSGTEGMKTAEVSLGGIDTDELSSKTFETKKVQGLYFIGESVDVTGHLGGFNFQWAWASGWCAGQYV